MEKLLKGLLYILMFIFSILLGILVSEILININIEFINLISK